MATSNNNPIKFHKRCGRLVLFSSHHRVASRNKASQEFNHGLVFSSRPLQDNQIFEVRLDKKINSWSGSIEIGVTTWNPNETESYLPPSATDLRDGSWILSGNSIHKDGRSITERYGNDLYNLEEGDRVGVLRASNGDLIFFINGVSQSVATTDIPENVYAVVDLYGKCAQVTLMDNSLQDARILNNALNNEATAAATSQNQIDMLSNSTSHNNITNSNIAASTCSTSSMCQSGSNSTHEFSWNNKIRFHEKRGSLVKLSNNQRTAERRRPFDEFNNGVVMTHRPLKNNELFEIRIDRLVDKWSGSIEVGITTHNPSSLDFPATMTNTKSGTMMMSGCGILTNGRGTRREYGNYNLDELIEGDRIGMMRKRNGDMHFYINGEDQGVAATKVPLRMYGVIDLYGMTVKVTIVDRDERDEQNLITRRNLRGGATALSGESSSTSNRALRFHPNCGSHAAVINSGQTAYRPNAEDDFNFGVVLTNRQLKPNEIFEVRLDKMVPKWAGSIEIGVTTHSPESLDFPSTMTNVRTGTWMMTGNGVMHNGSTIIDEYGVNLDKLKVGDRVAVVRKDSGTLHFYVNNEDQGPAAKMLPDCIYGVIDLYGQAAMATVLDVFSDSQAVSETETVSSSFTASVIDTSELRFHHLHGKNARVLNNGRTAARPSATGEFNDAIVITNRPLKDGEYFEVRIEHVVDRWSGSIEIGVTLIRPEDLEFPNTMTDIDYDTWMLSGSSIMQNGRTIKSGYCHDLDTLSFDSTIGLKKLADGTLRYTINGEDQGIAAENIPSNVYGVIDLYGQCAQVTIVQPINSVGASPLPIEASHDSLLAINSEISQKFSSNEHDGKTIEYSNNHQTCSLVAGHKHALAISAHPLENDESFVICLDKKKMKLSGNLKIGVTSHSSHAEIGHKILRMEDLGSITIWVEDSIVKANGKVIKDNFCPSLNRLREGDYISLKKTNGSRIKLYINGNEMGIIANNLPKKVWPVFELFGCADTISVIPNTSPPHPVNQSVESQLSKNLSIAFQDSLEVANVEGSAQGSGVETKPLSFHDNHGRNVKLKHGNIIAVRTESYNQGILVTNRPLAINEMFKVRVEKLNDKWSSSFMIGVLMQSPSKLFFPTTSLGFKKNSIIACGNSVFKNGKKLSEKKINPSLDFLKLNQTVGIMINSKNELRIYVNDVDQGVLYNNITTPCYGLFDLYGQCEAIKLINPSIDDKTSSNTDLKIKEDTKDNIDQKLVQKYSMVDRKLFTRKCSYLELCLRFKKSLGIPHSFFSSWEWPYCFCKDCFKIRGDTPLLQKGNPMKNFAQPLGWCKIMFKRKKDNIIPEEWHSAYHGTKPGLLRKILDHSNLGIPAEFGLQQKSKKSRKSKEDDIDSPQFIFSPTVKYITKLENLCPKIVFNDIKSKQRFYNCRIALQVEIQPGSYKVGPPTILSGINSPPDTYFKLEETEWLTKEKGNTAIAAILICVE